jgi:hypothetical protein
MLNTERPYWELSCPRSVNNCNTSAVEDMDRPKPMTSDDCQGSPNPNSAVSAMTSMVQATWANPRPKIDRRSTHNRDGCSSRPITNIRSTMPNSAMCNVVSMRLMSPRQAGPMIMPAAR